MTEIRCVSAIVMHPVDHRFFVQCRAGRKRGPYLWEFLSGKCEPGESLVDALAREGREEMGIHLFISQPEVFSLSVDLSSTEHLKISFFEAHFRGPLEPNPDEVLGFGWATPLDLRALQLVPGLEAALPQLEEHYERVLKRRGLTK